MILLSVYIVNFEHGCEDSQRVRILQPLIKYICTANNVDMATSLGSLLREDRFYVISVRMNFMSVVIFTISYWPALYSGSTVLSLWFCSMKMSNWPSIEWIFLMQMLQNISLCQSCLPEVWFWHPVPVICTFAFIYLDECVFMADGIS